MQRLPGTVVVATLGEGRSDQPFDSVGLQPFHPFLPSRKSQQLLICIFTTSSSKSYYQIILTITSLAFIFRPRIFRICNPRSAVGRSTSAEWGSSLDSTLVPVPGLFGIARTTLLCICTLLLHLDLGRISRTICSRSSHIHDGFSQRDDIRTHSMVVTVLPQEEEVAVEEVPLQVAVEVFPSALASHSYQAPSEISKGLRLRAGPSRRRPCS